MEQAIEALAFVRNDSARQLRSGRSRTLAHVMLDARNPFFTDVARGAQAAAEHVDLSLILSNSGGAASREAAHLLLLQQQRVHGVLITPVDPEAASLRRIQRRGTPVVLVGRAPSAADLCSVSVDELLGGQLALEHLLDRGHSRVAFVGGPSELNQVADRLRGARRAWAAAGRAQDDLIVVPTTALDIPQGQQAGAELTSMRPETRPTAAFCANDLLAIGLLQHAAASAVRVPHELAIVGYDDIDFAGAAAVPLTSVGQPREALGRAAVELILEETRDPRHEHRHVVFTPELVARDSTAPRPRGAVRHRDGSP